MSEEHKQYATSAAATLEAHILSVHSAKNEAEWWANREILRLRAENEKLRAENETHKEIAVRETMNVATLRAALKPFAIEAASFHPNFEDGHLIRDDMDLTLGDLRAAAAALKETGDE